MSTLVTCSRCGDQAERVDPAAGGRLCGLPRSWEHRDPLACPVCVSTTCRPAAELAAPVCGSCIAALLDRLLLELRIYCRGQR